MSVSNYWKSQSLIRNLIDQLGKRLPGYTLTENLTQYGDQLLVSQSSPAVAGENNAAIMMGFQDTEFTDVIGLPQAVYTPMEAQIVEEAASGSSTVSLVTLAFQLAINIELTKQGVKQAWYLNPNGTVPALSQFTSVPTAPSGSTLVEVIAPDQYWPLSGQ